MQNTAELKRNLQLVSEQRTLPEEVAQESR